MKEARKWIRKPISNEKARERIAHYQQALTVDQDNIHYWRLRIGKPLEFIDTFILGVDKIKSPEEFIERSGKNMEILSLKIEDARRFLTEPYKSFIH